MKYRIFVLFALVTILFSCQKALTIKELENRTVAQDYYNTPQRVEQAVIGGYVDLRRALLANYAWIMYGEARVGDLNVAVAYQKDVAAQNLTLNDRNVMQLTNWEYFYDVIKNANDVLDIVARSNGDILSKYEQNLFRGEALALKSMAYFYLARVWGDIPSAEKENMGKRLTNKEAVTRAAAWATEAKNLLPWLLINNDGIGSTALTAVRFNKTAIVSLLAHQELWLGNSQKAYDLLNNTFTPQTADSLSTFNLSMGTDNRVVIPAVPLNGNVVQMPLNRLNAIYPNADKRRTTMFTVLPKENIAKLIVRNASELEILPVREIKLLFSEAAWRSGHLSEAKNYLISAATGAVEDYNVLTEQTFGDALLLERQRMLVGTGQRVFDLIRFGKVSNYISLFTEADVSNGAAYWPVAEKSRKDNSWDQNRYWLNR